jgi:hypothetical protein
VTLQIVASLTDDTRNINYDHNTFIIQAIDWVIPLFSDDTYLFVEVSIAQREIFNDVVNNKNNQVPVS